MLSISTTVLLHTLERQRQELGILKDAEKYVPTTHLGTDETNTK